MDGTEEQVLDPWFEQELVCPRDKSDLRNQGTELVCSNAHRYPIVQGVPVMLFVDDTPWTTLH